MAFGRTRGSFGLVQLVTGRGGSYDLSMAQFGYGVICEPEATSAVPNDVLCPLTVRQKLMMEFDQLVGGFVPSPP